MARYNPTLLLALGVFAALLAPPSHGSTGAPEAVASPGPDHRPANVADGVELASGPTPSSDEPNKVGTTATSRSAAVLDKYYKQRYAEAGREGLAVLEHEPENKELRFVVANSLAWSGDAEGGLEQYKLLLNTEFHDRALLGWAEVNRWTGRSHRAAPAYRELLHKNPNNKEAQEGLRQVSRRLRPRTALQFGRAGNSLGAERASARLSHQWRDVSEAQIFELAAERMEEDKHGPSLEQRELSFSYEQLEGRFAPRIEISAQEAPRSHLFGGISLKLDALPAHITVGHINWGKLSFDPAALHAGLTANHVGGRADLKQTFGDFQVTYNAYRVSGGNVVHDAGLRFTPAAQPFSKHHLRLFTGLAARKARFRDSRYWSPEDGHYSALGGISADWSNREWDTYAGLQYGVPLGGESGNSWSASLGIKRWLGDNWSVAFDFWALHTPRDGGYRGNSGSLRIEKIW